MAQQFHLINKDVKGGSTRQEFKIEVFYYALYTHLNNTLLQLNKFYFLKKKFKF